MTDVQDVLNTRRTIHRFTDEQVADSILQDALVAASNAPCHKHTHPWKFYILGDKTRQTLMPVVTKYSEIKSKQRNSKDIQADLQRAISKITQPPILIAVTSKKSPHDDFREKEDYAASVCALHNMVLSFWGNGIGAKWSTGSITRDIQTYAALSIDMETEEIIGFIKAGYAEKIPQVNKKPISEITTYLD